MNTPRRTPADVPRRRRRSPARPAGLGLRRPAGARPVRLRLAQARRKLDLTQLLTLGAVLVSLAFALPQACTGQATLEETRAQRETDRAQNELDRQGQITDRFSTAIEQLGSDKLQIRLGGIYALERIAGDSDRDYPTVRNVLATFVREETRALASPQGGSCPAAPLTADVQAAVTALGQPHPRQSRYPADLGGACLAGADLTGLHLTGVDLGGAFLTDAFLTEASLADANLSGADLFSASLARTNLSGAALITADLSGAALAGANLLNADLFHADLAGANFTGASLINADFFNADLTSATFADADLTGTSFADADLNGANFAGVDPERLRQARARQVPGT